jgi:hypothetical protein
MVVAMLLHPIIAAAGVTAWIILVPGLARPRPAIAITALVAVMLVGLSATGIGPFRHFDAVWLGVLRDRLAYLFPTEWSVTEWVSTGVHAAILVVGIGFSRNEQIRRLCIATLITAVLGMLFASVESDGLHVIIAAQLQTWRWLWLLGVMSSLLLAPIAVDCWQSGDLGRAAALSMLGASLIRPDETAALPALLACIAAVSYGKVREPLQTKVFLVAAVVLLALSLVLLARDLDKVLPELQAVRSQTLPYMVRIGEAQALAYGGLLPAAVLGLACFSVQRATRRSAVLLAGLGAALLVSLSTYSALTWTHAKFPESRVQAFAPWRAAIPESAEVLWPDPPPSAWFELGRASYWSLYQMAGMVFSRDAMMMGTKRETTITPLLPGLGGALVAENHNTPPPQSKNARSAATGPCALPDITFYASWADLGPTPYPAVAPDAAKPHEMLYLYRCEADRH